MTRMGRLFIVLGALGGFAGVAAGASAQHLAGGDPGDQTLLETASHYLLIHGAVLVGLSILLESGRGRAVIVKISGIFLLLGMLLFGGGLIASALTNNAQFNILVPFGGTSFLIGWLALALYGLLRGRSSAT
jgi:uncharacterized membrane protein YgdD (TMEM256/DUF423 family)